MGVGDVTKVEMVWEDATGQELVNVAHYVQVADAGLFFDLTSLAAFAASIGSMVSSYQGLVSSYLTYKHTIATVVTGGVAGLQAVDLTEAGNPGATLGADGPVERCIIYSIRTLLVGRANRGRLFSIVPCRETFSASGAYNAGNPDNAPQAALVGMLLASRPGPATNCMNLCVFRRGPGVGIVAFNVLLQPRMGLQRRRRAR